MPCSNCTEVRPVPATFETLTLGTVEESTDYLVFLKNISTGMEAEYEITSDADGLLILDRELDGIKIVPGEWTEARVILADATDLTANVNILIGATNYTCLLIRFTEVFNPEEVRKLKLAGDFILVV
jgi:hypothetical protein